MRIASAVFGVTMVGLGIFDLITGSVPVPKAMPGREVLVYLGATLLVGSGLGLLWRRTAGVAARVLLAYFALELLALRAPGLVHGVPVDVYWPLASTSVMVAAAWVLYIRLAGGNERGLRIAQALYGAAMIPFGIAHFQFLDHTASMVPGWLPWHMAFAYVTGGAFIAAGVAIVTGIYARLATLLSALQIGGFLLLVWIPAVLAGGLSAFQKGEVVSNCILLAAAWVMADGYIGARSSSSPDVISVNERPDQRTGRSAARGATTPGS